MPTIRPLVPGELERQHPTALGFLDETGSISSDRFFGVGFLKLTTPSELTRAVQLLRDRRHWYHEIHFSEVTRPALPFSKEVVDAIAATPQCSFSCFVADRAGADPIERFGNSWLAYQKLAQQLIIGSVRPRELVAVLADNYSTPAHDQFEEAVKYEVNRRLGRLAVTSVSRLDSRAADALQLVDLLTGAVAFEFRQAAGLASVTSTKGRVCSGTVWGSYCVDRSQRSSIGSPWVCSRSHSRVPPQVPHSRGTALPTLSWERSVDSVRTHPGIGGGSSAERRHRSRTPQPWQIRSFSNSVADWFPRTRLRSALRWCPDPPKPNHLVSRYWSTRFPCSNSSSEISPRAKRSARMSWALGLRSALSIPT